MASAKINQQQDSSRPLAVTMKGRIASRAHSFKENILEAFGHHHQHVTGGNQHPQQQSGQNNPSNQITLATSNNPNNIQLAKKTNSSDNLIGYSEPKHDTEVMVRDMQLSLRYFEDAVSKGTLELLPGCASIVLERVVAIQGFICYDNQLKDDERLDQPMNSLYSAVSNLTDWADSVIVSGTLSSFEDVREKITEPVRKAVLILVNKVNESLALDSNGSSKPRVQMRNSLPDITNPENEVFTSPPTRHTSTKSSSDAKSPTSPTNVGLQHHYPPPLPPKYGKSTNYQRDSLHLDNLGGLGGQVDWFSNPLFEQGSAKIKPHQKYSKCETSFIDSQLPSPPHGLDTTLPESSSFPFMDDMTSPVNEMPPKLPPALPKKESKRKKSHYDNVLEQSGCKSPLVNFLSSSQSFDYGNADPSWQVGHGQTNSGVARTLFYPKEEIEEISHSRRNSVGNGPPPLPPKKRDIINYMEILGKSLLPSREELMQSLAQTQLLLQNVWAENSHQFGEFVPDNSAFQFPASRDLFTMNMDLSRLSSPGLTMKFPDFEDNSSLISSKSSNVPPALPPKKNRNRSSQNSSQSHRTSSVNSNPDLPHSSLKERIVPIIRESDGTIVRPQPHPAPTSYYGSVMKRYSIESVGSVSPSTASNYSAGNEDSESGPEKMPSLTRPTLTLDKSQAVPSSPSYYATSNFSDLEVESNPSVSISSADTTAMGGNSNREANILDDEIMVHPDSALNLLEPLNWRSLIYANNAEGILELRAGDVDDLIVLATQSTNRDFVYQDAFLLTYCTFISTKDLLWKLEYRFRKFNCIGDPKQLKAARSSFSLLVRVVDGLIDCDFMETEVVRNLSEFISELVRNGDLLLARALRKKFIQKYELHRSRMMPDLDFSMLNMPSQKSPSLLQFKSSDLAEQITLLDAQHFWKIEPGEILSWVKEQNEEKSPNLAKFTKHFNAMSFWCRTKILMENDHKERERLVTKFIKVMKVLRKHNNFNSYLAFLSALESASIRRLDWSKTIMDTLKEYSGIIDFTGSFKAYRVALTNASPPVIPYMGLILQDLTFVHIGNQDNVKNKVNFAKRWQQYNILDNMRRFKRETYRFDRKDAICQFFGNFEDFLSENELWEISEKLKPRSFAQQNSSSSQHSHGANKSANGDVHS